MGDRARIALGAFAAAGIVLVTYLLVKRLGHTKTKKKSKDESTKTNKAGGDCPGDVPKSEKAPKELIADKEVDDALATDVKTVEDASVTDVRTIQPDTTGEEPVFTNKEEDTPVTSLVAAVENLIENVNEPQTLAQGVIESEIQAESDIGLLSSVKKAEHSSDESSYDVIEDEAAGDIAKTDDLKDEIDTDDLKDEIVTADMKDEIVTADIKDEIDTADIKEEINTADIKEEIDTEDTSTAAVQEPTPECKENEQTERVEEQSFHDSIDSSMVVVDEALEQSSTSYYTTADESVEVQPDETFSDGAGHDESDGHRGSTSTESEAGEKTLSTSLADQSVVFVGEDKPEDNIDDSVVFMGEEMPQQTEMAASVDLSSWQKEEIISGNIAEMAQSMGSWLEVTEESAKEAEDINEQQEETAAVNAPTDVPFEPVEMPSEERMTEVLTACQSDPSSVSKEDLEVLAAILSLGTSSALEASVLDSLVRVSAFTQHNVNIRNCGFPDMITSRAMDSCQHVVQGEPGSKERLGQLCQVVTNFSLDPKTMGAMEAVVPALINVACLDSVSEVLQLSLLQPLTNFSSTSTYLHHFHRLVQPLFDLLESGTSATCVKVLKVLVNLSLDAEMLPHLLAAKAPVNLLDLLDLPTPNDVILRTVTFLANVEECLYSSPRAPLALPVEEKVESPLTMHVALRGVDGAPQLRNKVFRLTRHEDEDVVFQASRLYKVITAPPK